MPKVKGLTYKEKEYLKEKTLNGFNGTQACMKVYNPSTYDSAKSLAYKANKRIAKVHLETPKAIDHEEMGILKRLTPEYILQGIESIAIDARTPKHTRLKALELLGKFKDLGLWREYQITQATIKQDTSVDDLNREFRELANPRTSEADSQGVGESH